MKSSSQYAVKVMMAVMTLSCSLLVTFSAEAKVAALFHPYDNTLAQIAGWFAQAQGRIDIAMYNLETSEKSEVIAFLKKPETQQRIQNGNLKVRMVFEGYGTDEQNEVRMKEIETTGIDVRYLGASKKVHHKFAVIDGDTNSARLITGSANWSLSSLKNYNENILFIDHQQELAEAFQQQFELLWKNAKTYGNDLQAAPIAVESVDMTADTKAHFNSENFKFGPGGVKNDPKAEGFHLTRQVVRAIESAQSEIEIASTRLKLRPIYEALKKAAERGVKVKMVISMDDFEPIWIREKSPMKECADFYEPSCSSGTSFGIFLSEIPNAEVRVKYYNLKYREYITKQMHSKYILIDGKHLLTGSFNWSVSSEKEHIENIVELSGSEHAEVLAQFQQDFTKLWDMGRANYDGLLNKVTAAPSEEPLKCGFEPMVLEYSQIDNLLKAFTGKKCQ